MNKPRVVGETYSVIEKGREVFTGKCTKIMSVAGRPGNLVRIEDARGNYHLQFNTVADFVDPSDAPKKQVPTEAERNAQPWTAYCDYRR